MEEMLVGQTQLLMAMENVNQVDVLIISMTRFDNVATGSVDCPSRELDHNAPPDCQAVEDHVNVEGHGQVAAVGEAGGPD